jgi:hypothetical protein
MGFGGQSSALITISRAQGFDPTVIPARGDIPAQSIAPFDVDPTLDKMTHKTTGKLPQGIRDSYASDHPEGLTFDAPVRWNHPQFNDGNLPHRGSSGAAARPGRDR